MTHLAHLLDIRPVQFRQLAAMDIPRSADEPSGDDYRPHISSIAAWLKNVSYVGQIFVRRSISIRFVGRVQCLTASSEISGRCGAAALLPIDRSGLDLAGMHLCHFVFLGRRYRQVHQSKKLDAANHPPQFASAGETTER